MAKIQREGPLTFLASCLASALSARHEIIFRSKWQEFYPHAWKYLSPCTQGEKIHFCLARPHHINLPPSDFDTFERYVFN